jgi:hypothetical protein
MISVICVYNNPEILENFLLKSLKEQDDHELILIDNNVHKFESAAQTLNYGANKAQNEYLMFVHQDISIDAVNWLKDTENLINSLDKLGVAGVAGKIPKYQSVVTNIKQGIPPISVSPCKINHPQEAQTVDECLFIIPKFLFDKIKFDEDTCHDWHLYAVDFCLTAKEWGYQVYLLPLSLYHRSPGYSMSDEYDVTLTKLLQKHRKFFRVISTTMGEWVTLYSLERQKKYPWFKNKIVNFFRLINAFEK